MIRSHTKGIYVDDSDGSLVVRLASVQKLIREIEPLCETRNYGFAKLYPRVVGEYFGGMRRHFRTLRDVLKPDAKLAYVVGDQSSYLQVHIPTAEILAQIAELEGYEVESIEHWRTRRSTANDAGIGERVLLLRWPGGK